MTPRALARLFLGWLATLFVACTVTHCAFVLRPPTEPTIVASVWRAGTLQTRTILHQRDPNPPELASAIAAGGTLVFEAITGEGPVLTNPPAVLSFSLVPAHDGLSATLGTTTAYVTPDDLLAHQGYDRAITLSPGMSVGVDLATALALFSKQLHVPAGDILAHARIRRFRVERDIVATPPLPPPVTPETLDLPTVAQAASAGARYLSGGVAQDGRFRYLVRATSNVTINDYEWTRHAGATYFLAQEAARSQDASIIAATRRAASALRQKMRSCGPYRCLALSQPVEIGPSALGLLAFVEIVRTGIDPSYLTEVGELARYLRAQQRADGEYMHEYDPGVNKPLDVQYPFYSGETSFALARAERLTHDPADLASSVRGLAYLTGKGWSFFGGRYYMGEEHWTCQAMDDLWERAPSRQALDFCLRWAHFNEAVQQRKGDAVYDSDGAITLSPLALPRLTPVGSRAEAGIATLDAARKAGVPAEEIARIDRQMRRALALLIRHQFAPGPAHLFADPGALYGAMPGSEVDWDIRIDYVQHACSAFERWLEWGAASR